MNPTLQKIQEIKRHGYQLDLGEAISQTFENYKKIALLAGAVILLFSIVMLVVLGGAAAIIFGAAAFTESMTDITAMSTSTSGILMNLLVSVIGYALVAPLYAGIIQMAHQAETNEDFDFGTAFTHYKSVHFKHIFMATALITLFSSGISTILQIVLLYTPDVTMIAVSTVVSIVVACLTPLFTLVMIPLIIFGNLNATEAIYGSFVLVMKKFWIILLLGILFAIFAFIGIIALCIGVFFTAPVIYSLQYIIYRNAIPMEDKTELDEIGQSYF